MILLEKLWRIIFPLQITKRFYVWMIFLIIVPTGLLALTIQAKFLQQEELERKKELYAVAVELEQLLPGSFREILERRGALNKSIDEQVRVLNAVLQPIVNKVSLAHPGLGMGYYSIELERILAIGPEFDNSLLVQIPRSYPYFEPYHTGKAEFVYSSTSIAWNGKFILHLGYPIYHGDKIIGHTWASVKMGDVYAEALAGAKDLLLIGLILLGAVVYLGWLIFTQFKREMERFAHAVVRGSPTLSESVLPELNPLLEVVKQSQQAMRTAVAGQFAASVVHEIRNPFTSIRGFSQLLLLKETDQQKKSYLELIINEVDRVNSIITNFLRFAKPAKAVIEACPITKLLADVEALVGSRCFAAGVRLEITINEDDLRAICDPNQVKQVLLNLIQNALQAMEGMQDRLISVKAYCNHQRVLLEVSDNGPGIAPEYIDKIFEPFFTTKASGTGLGLSICRQILEQQGGTLDVKSEPGVGSTFIVSLCEADSCPN